MRKWIALVIGLFLIFITFSSCAKNEKIESANPFPTGTIELSKSEFETTKEVASKYSILDKNQFVLSQLAMEQFLKDYYQNDINELEIYFILSDVAETEAAAYYEVNGNFYVSQIDKDLLLKMIRFKSNFVYPMIKMENGTLKLSVFGKNYPN